MGEFEGGAGFGHSNASSAMKGVPVWGIVCPGCLCMLKVQMS